jgi:hypothetical protein
MNRSKTLPTFAYKRQATMLSERATWPQVEICTKGLKLLVLLPFGRFSVLPRVCYRVTPFDCREPVLAANSICHECTVQSHGQRSRAAPNPPPSTFARHPQDACCRLRQLHGRLPRSSGTTSWSTRPPGDRGRPHQRSPTRMSACGNSSVSPGCC